MENVLEITTRQDNNVSITFMPVKYGIEKILEAGFTFKGDIISEIEGILNVCVEFIK